MKHATLLVLLLAAFYIGLVIVLLFLPSWGEAFAISSAAVLSAAGIYCDYKGELFNEPQ